MKRTMDRAQRLRAAAKRLRREAGEAKTERTRDIRAEAAERLDEMAAEHDMAMARWEAHDHPAVRGIHDRAVAEALDRAAIRKEVPEPVEYTSPALQALATTDQERHRAAAWGAENQPIEGWLGT